MNMDVDPIIIVHGGAGWRRIEDESKQIILDHIKKAVDIGWKILLDGGSAVDAVTEAISYMEDSGYFNAGLGSCLNISGVREMDAGIMDGYLYRAGAVASVKYPKNPIKLARYIMENLDHIILCCKEADRLAEKIGLSKISNPPQRILDRYNKLIRDEDYLRRFPKNARIFNLFYNALDTVGAVALDSRGRISAGSSTGGIWLKIPGRIGDSPIPGAGFYADEYIGISSTGFGEHIIYSMPGVILREYIELGYNVRKGLDRLFKFLKTRFGLDNMGLIGLTGDGEIIYKFDTVRMLVGYRTRDKSFINFVERD
ncbi:asparaginase [Candidatus Geothermarchaeota archaeon]|nr:MAG: asparaginase [Candidatus Geothermarchaeota archaeon]RLG62314.1 MAG: asparaginase [Candidatus Geothermarchaeota archaeon]HEW93568.1 asparaginase [Thermoprotei archaeon]